MSGTDRAVVAGLLAVLASAPVQAQTQWGTAGGSTWGQFGAPGWGRYQNTINPGGWQLNQGLRPNEPGGALLTPNQQIGGKSSSIFTQPDTRLLGRNGP